jgi:hypothetical protein
MLSSLSTTFHKSTRLLFVLERTIQINGWKEFSRIAQNSLKNPISDPEIVPSIQEFLNRSKTDFLDLKVQLKKLVHKPGLVASPTILQTFLSGISLSSGFFWAFILSHKDLRLYTSNRKTNAIFLHRPLVIGTDILLEWLMSMLELAKLESDLAFPDRRNIERLSFQLVEFKKGLNLGQYRKDLLIKFLLSTKVVKSRKNVSLQVDPEFFSWLNYAISSQHD